MENINGFKAKKWTTTLEFSKFTITIDEWSVKDLALLRHADSLNKRVLISQGLSDTLIALTTYGRGLSNNEMILGTTKLDSLYDANNISPILGEIIKGIVRKTDKGEDEYDMSFGLEMVELYAEDYIPEKDEDDEEEAHTSTDDAEEEDIMGKESDIEDEEEEEEEESDEDDYESDLGSELSEESYVDSD